MLILLIYGGGGLEFGKTCLYNANSLPISHVSINNNTNKNFNNKNNNNKKQQQQQKQQKQNYNKDISVITTLILTRL